MSNTVPSSFLSESATAILAIRWLIIGFIAEVGAQILRADWENHLDRVIILYSLLAILVVIWANMAWKASKE